MRLYPITGYDPAMTIHAGGIEWPLGWPLPAPGQRIKLDGESWEVINVEFEPEPPAEGVGWGGDAPASAIWVRVQKPFRREL